MKRLILLRLVDMLVGVLLVPSLTLSVAHGVVDLAPVFLAVTRDAHLCKQHRCCKVGRGVDAQLTLSKSGVLDRNNILV